MQAIELAKGAGAAEAWATASQGRDVEFEYRDGALEKVKDTTSRSLNINIYAGGRYSSHQTTDLNPERLKGFVAEAVAITRALEPDEHRSITPAELFNGRPTVDLDLVDAAVAGITREQRLAWCEELDEVATAHERVISATAGIYDGTSNSASASSNGFTGTHAETYCWYGTNITLMDQGDKRASDGYYVGGQHVASLPAAAGVAQTGLERALNAPGHGKRSDDQDINDRGCSGGRIAGRSPARPRECARVQQGQSFWADLVGKQAFSEKLTISDDPLIPRGFGSRLFDSEGISAKYLPIVENGVVRNLYVDTYHGRKAGMAPTTGSASNRVIAPGELSLDGAAQGSGRRRLRNLVAGRQCRPDDG